MYFIGLDLGQKRDYSAVVVVERVAERLNVRYVERMALGTPYPLVVERVRGIVRSDELGGDCVLAVDATGVGAPVVDLLRVAALDCPVMPVVLTAGDREGFDGRSWRIPKVDLYTRVQILLEQERLRVAARVREGEALRKELLDVRARQGAGGRVRVGAEGFGEHDDLVMAVALAVWAGRERTQREVFVGRGRSGEARRVV